ncbi:hypothetical protein [Aureivirga sp. CE67]|uniref:hypothetical protein n=1 Tax=Aureivirga sp. CE67 TaxID=1788983 RepID=UPI0018CB0EA8|nr:hypothetical protein [Aureivirga sp. CE67]
MKLKKLILLCLLITISITSYAQGKNTNIRTIEIGGLILDTENSSPLKDAEIFDNKSNLLGITDSKGYFNVELKQKNEGNLSIFFSVKKKNYETIIIKENWGNFGKGIKVAFISDLKKKNSKTTKVFNNLEMTNDNSYKNVSNKLKFLKKINSIDEQIRKEAEGNEKVFFEIDGAYYIVYDENWLKIDTKNEIVSIDRELIIRAGDLNSKIKRSEIVFMSTFNNKPFKVLINTK